MEKHKIEFNFNVGDEVYFMDKNIVATGVVSEIDIKVTTVQKHSIVYKIKDIKNQNSKTFEALSVYREQSFLFGSKQELIESL